jgi:ABC-2 type transport system permease protein
VVDQANTSASTGLIAELEKSEAVRPEALTLEEAEDEFSQRTVSAVLVIPQDFDQSAIAAQTARLDLRQQPNSLNALAVEQALRSAIWRISSAVEIANRSVETAQGIQAFASNTDRQAFFDASLAEAQTRLTDAPDRISVTQGGTKDEVDYDPRANSSAGQLITWVFIPLIGISGMFAYERQQGTLRRLLTTPTQQAVYLLGTILGQVLIALVQMLLLVGFGVLVMNVNWGNDPAGLAVMMIAGALAAAALGTTLGTFVKSEGQASGLSIMLGMVMALMGGCWYPIELFPEVVRTAVKVLPTTWAMQGLLDLVLRGQGLQGILLESGVLVGFAAVFFVVGVARFRYE